MADQVIAWIKRVALLNRESNSQRVVAAFNEMVIRDKFQEAGLRNDQLITEANERLAEIELLRQRNATLFQIHGELNRLVEVLKAERDTVATKKDEYHNCLGETECYSCHSEPWAQSNGCKYKNETAPGRIYCLVCRELVKINGPAVQESHRKQAERSKGIKFTVPFSTQLSDMCPACSFPRMNKTGILRCHEYTVQDDAIILKALGQALAQAATNFIIRKQEERGLNGHLKDYFCISDGESWRFGYITEGRGEKLDVQQANTATCWFHQRHMIPKREECSKMFSYIVFWIKRAIESSRTTSRRNSESANGVDLDNLNIQFDSASIE